MGWLTAAQTATVKAVREKAWTREFTLQTPGAEVAEPDFYDVATGSATSETLYCDWIGRDEIERRGSPGGVINGADILFTCDIDHFTKLSVAGVRLIIEGVTYAVMSASTYPDTGDCVVAGKKIS